MDSCLLHLCVLPSREIFSTLLQLSASQTLTLMTLSLEQFSIAHPNSARDGVCVCGSGGRGQWCITLLNPKDSSMLIKMISFTKDSLTSKVKLIINIVKMKTKSISLCPGMQTWSQPFYLLNYNFSHYTRLSIALPPLLLPPSSTSSHRQWLY